MWEGEDKAPVCITIFSAPNYCQHENPGTIFVTDPTIGSSRVLTFQESAHHNYFLPDPETMEHPEVPFDAIRWFMPAMKEWIT